MISPRCVRAFRAGIYQWSVDRADHVVAVSEFTRKALVERCRVPPGKVEAIRLPIGLDIGAETPEEIAISIAAELVAARRNSAALVQADADRKARRWTPGR